MKMCDMRRFKSNIILLLPIVLILFGNLSLIAQDDSDEPSDFLVKGYLKNLQLISFQDAGGEWLLDNIIHNRLNFKWYANNYLNFSLEMRNRLFYGETVKSFPAYADITGTDYGLVDMNWIPVSKQSFFLQSNIDRAYVEYARGNWELRVGRQRINWGQTFVWNPNDVFNAYSFFDFDYEERPGSDAVLARYYTGVTSSAEVAIAFADSLEASKIAGMYRFNRWSYDFQLIGGKIARDWMLGFGWSGQLGTAGFKGELTWLQPRKKEYEEDAAVVATVSVDYTFKNQLYLQSEVIFNSSGSSGSPGAFNFFQQLSTRNLSLTKFSFFLQSSYPITPLISAGLAGIYSPNDQSAFVGPSFDFSLSDNLGFLLTGQVFSGDEESQYGSAGTIIYSRLKWSF